MRLERHKPSDGDVVFEDFTFREGETSERERGRKVDYLLNAQQQPSSNPKKTISVIDLDQVQNAFPKEALDSTKTHI